MPRMFIHLGQLGSQYRILRQEGRKGSGLGNSLFEDNAEYGLGMLLGVNRSATRSRIR